MEGNFKIRILEEVQRKDLWRKKKSSSAFLESVNKKKKKRREKGKGSGGGENGLNEKFALKWFCFLREVGKVSTEGD